MRRACTLSMLLVGLALGCPAEEDDMGTPASDTDPSPQMLDDCLEACAAFTEAECNPAQELSVCEASCEASDAELVGAFIECVDADVCDQCNDAWCLRGCA